MKNNVARGKFLRKVARVRFDYLTLALIFFTITFQPSSLSASKRHLACFLNVDSIAIDSLPNHSHPDSLNHNLANIKLNSSDTLKANHDSIPLTRDSIPFSTTNSSSQSIPSSNDTTKGDEKPIVLEDVVKFSAKDSMVMKGQNEAFLYGDGFVKYQTMELNASFMKLRVDSAEVFAKYVLDEKGRPTKLPHFSDGEQQFEMESMRYNYNTERGFITGVLTQQEGGYLTGDKGKRMPDNVMYLEGGNYTTCNNVLHPHFHLHMTKAKVTPNKSIVTGPVYLVMGGIPLFPIGLPFGYIPLNKTRTSGVILPSYGEESERGFYLRNFGFYFVPNDYFDVTLRGDYYTLGSWAAYLESNYNVRYKYSGNLSISFVNMQTGDKTIPGDYTSSRDFSVNWSHRQDAKVDPLRTFSASVNFSTSSYNHNSNDAMYDPDKRAQNTKGSSVSYSRRFTSIPLNITAALNIDQRSRDSTISVTLPNISISLSTIYPFKRKRAVGRERWYEKISLSYSGSLSNSITTKENMLLKSNLIKDWRNGMRHSIPISASFDLFNYIKITPSVSYNASWGTRKVRKQYDPELHRVAPVDTTYGFYHLNDFNASLSLSTTLYGFYKPWVLLFGDGIQMIRHRFSPSISISYRPDFGTPFWGYYDTIHYLDENGTQREEVYSPYEGGLYGVPGRGKSGIISMNFANNLEMKLRGKTDSVGDEGRKISLIDQFDWRLSYNMAADSFQWSNINASLALRFTPSIALRLNGDFDTYLYDYTLDNQGKPIPRRVNKLRIAHGKGFGRLRSTGTSFNYTFNNQTIEELKSLYNKLFRKNNSPNDSKESSYPPNGNEPNLGNNPFQLGNNNPMGDPTNSRSEVSRANYQRPEEMGELDKDGYVMWNFPWSLSFSYSMSLGYNMQNFDVRTREYAYKLQHNLSFRGEFSPTRNWHFSFDANYNFEIHKVTNMTISATRSLHCWELTANIIPLGPYKSYMVTIGASAELLKDLRYQQSNLTTTSGFSGRRF